MESSYNYVWPFSDDGSPEQGELQKPDPLDGHLYRDLIIKTGLFSYEFWEHIEEEVLHALRYRTLEYVSAVTKMKISYHCREIQWMNHYLVLLGKQNPALLLRMQYRARLIHAEMTKMTAIHLEYVDRYPNLNYLSKVVKGVAWVSFAARALSGYAELKDAIIGWKNDVRNRVDTAGAAILSVTAQQLISEIPDMPPWVQVALSPTVPYFDPCPLGEYDGGSDCPYY